MTLVSHPEPVLSIVMPVYNEEGSIGTVVHAWMVMLRRLAIPFEFCVYNDGSKDTSLHILQELAEQYAELRVVDKGNSGHGPTVLQGYLSAQTAWIFQTDSDNEIDPGSFLEFWQLREEADLVIGYRENRDSPIARRIVSLVSRLTVAVLYGSAVRDVNCPFRLYRRETFRPAFSLLLRETFAPNVILSGYAGAHGLRVKELPVKNHARATGTVSIRKWGLVKAAVRSWVQTIAFWWSHVR